MLSLAGGSDRAFDGLGSFAHCSEYCEDGGRAFEFVAPCNSTVSVIISDARFVPNNGTAPLDLSGTSCGGKLRPRRLCKSCGPFTFTVACPPRCV